MGSAQSTRRGRDRARSGYSVARRFPGENQRQGTGGEVMGAASGCAESRLRGWVCDSLWVELDGGSDVCGRADGGVVIVCRAEDESGGAGGGNKGGSAGGRVGGWLCEGGGGGDASERVDGVGERERGGRKGYGDERERQGGGGRWWDVSA
ncbi:UDP-Glycosyltransferase superfamily protein [Actinidia rufa]|uniref:UDP-Glycosyltransferase superfamily protein n=1 Tax=Actinidia rufa TaxID=165716 RepID=A0A7J0ECS8_9ERIC|nr:UDP-Glycosyltransferase superfamily protein [Actinidia rufa]